MKRPASPIFTVLSCAAALFAFGACASSDGDDVRVSVAPSVLFPKGILDQVTRLNLRVFDTTPGATCNVDDGTASGNLDRMLVEQDLSSEGCPEGARFCGNIGVRRASTPYIFAAEAWDARDRRIANGCVEDRIDQPRRDLTIQMRRYLEPATCANGTLEPTEQCDPSEMPDKLVCNAECHTLEVYLSAGNGEPGTVNGAANDKQRPVAVWPNGKGSTTDDKFYVFFSDRSPATREITMRVRSNAFGRFAGLGNDVADFSLFLPHTPGEPLPPTEQPNNQTSPAAVHVAGHTWVAFEDDTDGNIDIRLRSIDATLTAEQPSGALRINGTAAAGEPGAQTLPAIAASSADILFIAWQDESGAILGRTFTPGSNDLGSTRTLSSGSGNRNVRVTGRADGFVAVWENGSSEIRLALLSPDGTPSPEQKVNGESRTGPVSTPVVAALTDKRFAVAYSDRGDIFVQRFDKDAKAITGDQEVRVNELFSDGDQRAPAIAAMPASGGSYALAWVDGAPTSGHVRAAYLGGTSGFLFNPIDAQASEFQASVSSGGQRSSPSIAVGGSAPHVGIVWEEVNGAKPGIYGRRLPMPLD